MGANVNVTYQDMRDAAKHLVNGQHEIEHKLQDMKKYIDNLVSNGYVTDRSSKQFEQSYTEFNHGATQTIQGLEGMAKFLENAAQAFADADDQLARGI
ncbi:MULTISPECIES: WXG100 family type VII secretion target [Streptomycetaceae]|uniref:ESAT-6-like protein n=1 Tax=Streptantibioticus cattleyicolor (strain ATCC 35852 / DSM 46488 / JCM 4925 / NBRC 14057 / NRRL 8057) TaxID=1003195 RepID=F8JXE9_STREN|nr:MULTISPECIES: WXG100 family type VII secretion target [Streptomycetaceae]AEW95828.1 hypothetical protein SCATT_34570 [Streptantibioticus cattleyicolor NRRL 8057 = DSM 46488]MYS60372.1 WXG100 family type VII secretion target [Streptomyces sp. SID5468]CCB76168.1 conserved protein of unknown function [Streptantibioticus cattleyicolor NRRL 8057 = DSM 46488]